MAEQILALTEIEVFVSNISISKIDDIGGISWFECHKRLHMLYQEALLETINGDNERIKEVILLNGKMKALVFEAISLSVWRYNVFPQLCANEFEKEKIFPVFVMLYHETTAFGLVESLAFHSDCVESLGDSAVELLDYCVACVLQMINRKVPRPQTGRPSELSSRQELSSYESDVVHNLAAKAVTVLRFIAEAFQSLPLSITSRFYNNHDVPMLLCKVIELEPWFTTDLDDKPYEYIDGNWKRMGRGPEDEALNKSAGQAWLSLRQVLLDQSFAKYYELNDFRTRHLCKMVRYLHDEVIDQLSPLAELKHFLCRLSCGAGAVPTTSTSRPLILELDAQFRDKLLRKYANKWEIIAKKLTTTVNDLDMAQIQVLAKGLAQAYETLDMVEPEPAKCANCGDPAAKRCSRCKTEWYCGRVCQVKMWDNHKTICNTISEDFAQ